MTRFCLTDLQDCGSCRAFRHLGRCPCQLVVQFSVFVVFSVTAISPSLGRSERPFRDPLYQLPRLVLRVDISQPCSNLSRKPPKGRVAWPALRVKSFSVLQSQSASLRVASCPAQILNGVGQVLGRRSTCTAGHHTVPGKKIRKSQESCTVPVYVLSVNSERERREETCFVRLLFGSHSNNTRRAKGYLPLDMSCDLRHSGDHCERMVANALSTTMPL